MPSRPLAPFLLGLAAASVLTASAAQAAEPSPPEGMALPIVHAAHRAAQPVVVVVAQGKAVLSDFVVPYGVLSQSGAAKVIAVNIADGPLKAGPLTLAPDMTASEFDRAFPDGADYVIVPATADKHAEEVAWLKAQRAHGAALISICDGVEVVAETGALAGRRATGHWASLPKRRRHFPNVTWLSNLRYVADGDVASSAGVSASLPISLALVETIAGPQAARDTAARLGVSSWGSAHDSDAFKLRHEDFAVHAANMHAKPEVVAIKVQAGDDPVALSLTAEPWSRTMRDEVHLVADSAGSVRLAGGLRVEAEAAGAVLPAVSLTLARGGAALPASLDQIAQRYGAGSARLAALAMEYPWGDLAASAQAAAGAQAGR